MKDYGKTAYEAYCQATGGVSLISGQPLPAWETLDERIQKAWCTAASAAIAAVDWPNSEPS